MSNDKIDDGGPAHPMKYLQGHRDGAGTWKDMNGWTWEPGLSKREHYAATCPITMTEFMNAIPNTGKPTGDVAVKAYCILRTQYADALIAALKKRPEAGLAEKPVEKPVEKSCNKIGCTYVGRVCVLCGCCGKHCSTECLPF